jgi:hypothetical protein
MSRYVDAAGELSEAVKTNIIKGGEVNKDTILKLNAFIIAENAIKEIVEEIKVRGHKNDN